ncbi:hypothetical protein [Paenibacillus sp. BK720]|uniref:hypothetical protein n=1 Tax=Paenibacillus sp. BK720 TaxID=2587092 RepID=UPI0014244028|nr:hypothetical protein [Paenibacillus sp. BK720]NIK68779.1 hypothetical protein [Paenibacillus sp. BK720]
MTTEQRHDNSDHHFVTTVIEFTRAMGRFAGTTFDLLNEIDETLDIRERPLNLMEGVTLLRRYKGQLHAAGIVLEVDDERITLTEYLNQKQLKAEPVIVYRFANGKFKPELLQGYESDGEDWLQLFLLSQGYLSNAAITYKQGYGDVMLSIYEGIDGPSDYFVVLNPGQPMERYDLVDREDITEYLVKIKNKELFSFGIKKQ